MGLTDKIGIIGAMQSEVEGIRARMEILREETVSGVTFAEGNLCGCRVVVATCGVGKVFSAIAAEAMILRFGVTALVNTGVAGGLAEGLSVGDIVIADRVVQHDMNTMAVGDARGFLSGIDRVYLETDVTLTETLVKAAREEGLSVQKGTIASGDLFVAKEKTKAHLREWFDAAACEMEGASIGQVAYVNRVPFAVLRAISDGGDGMEFSEFVRFAAERSVAVLCRFLSLIV